MNSFRLTVAGCMIVGLAMNSPFRAGPVAEELAPTRVPGDFAGRPPTEVVDAIGKATNFPLRFTPAGRNAQGRSDPPLRVPEGPTFWETIDRLASTSRLEVLPRMATEGRRIDLEPVPTGPAPATVSGAFRCSLVGLEQTGLVVYGDSMDETAVADVRGANKAPAMPVAVRHLTAKMLLLAEPRPLIDVQLAGPPRVDEALDDRGRSLALLPPKLDNPDRYQRERYLFGLGLVVPLDSPVPPGRSLRRLRGSIPVVTWVKQPRPLEVNLRPPVAGSIQGSGVVLKVLATRPAATAQGVVLVEMAPVASHPTVDPKRVLFESGPDRMFLDHKAQFELFDTDGKRIEATVATSRAQAANTWQVKLTPSSKASPKVPARLNFYGLVWSQTEIPFDFAELPLP